MEDGIVTTTKEHIRRHLSHWFSVAINQVMMAHNTCKIIIQL